MIVSHHFFPDTRLRYVDADETIGGNNWVLGDLRSLHRCVPAFRRPGIISFPCSSHLRYISIFYAYNNRRIQLYQLQLYYFLFYIYYSFFFFIYIFLIYNIKINYLNNVILNEINVT